MIAERSVGQFVGALAFNWIVAAADAHAENYSFLLAGHQVRLAPLYDLASALPYNDMDVPKLRPAMRIGGEYGVERISGRHWRRFAEANILDPDETVARIDDLAMRTPDCLALAVARQAVQVLDRVADRARECRAALRH